MKIDNSNKGYARFIAGILVASIIAIFMASTLGFGSSFDLKQNAVNTNAEGFQPNQRKSVLYNDLGDNNHVSVAHERNWCHVDTEEGSLIILEDNVPDFETDGVPLCIKQDIVDNWHVYIESKGGYHPSNNPENNKIKIYQKKSDCFLGTIYITWEDVTPDDADCCTTIWMASFTVVAKDGSDCIAIESNKFPESSITSPWSLDKCVPEATDLDKWVRICLESEWCGCGCDSQCFEIILTIRVCFQTPQLPK